jgi:hypothetical protein
MSILRDLDLNDLSTAAFQLTEVTLADIVDGGHLTEVKGDPHNSREEFMDGG